MNRAALLRRLRGLIGNAFVWGAAWFVSAFVVMVVLRLLGGNIATARWMDAVRGAAMFGVMGGIASTAFSLVIAVRYRGRRLTEINWLVFGLGGAVVTGIFVPTFISLMRFLSGDSMLAAESLLRNGLVGFVFGGSVAAVTIKVAQSAERLLPSGSGDPVARLDDPDGR